MRKYNYEVMLSVADQKKSDTIQLLKLIKENFELNQILQFFEERERRKDLKEFVPEAPIYIVAGVDPTKKKIRRNRLYENENLQCPLCVKRFANKGVFTMHIRKVHKVPLEEIRKNGWVIPKSTTKYTRYSKDSEHIRGMQIPTSTKE